VLNSFRRQIRLGIAFTVKIDATDTRHALEEGKSHRQFSVSVAPNDRTLQKRMTGYFRGVSKICFFGENCTKSGN